MKSKLDGALCVEEEVIAGHVQTLTLRSYRPSSNGRQLPVILYFHGGGFVRGTLEDGDAAASHIARTTPAWVVSVGYSLSPAFPFPAALEDGIRAARWAVANARAMGANGRRIGICGHDAGGNLATCIAAMARDRESIEFLAQALIAPLLDPSMTRIARSHDLAGADFAAQEYSRCYRAYLPYVSLLMHPYAAPIESLRLSGLPPALIASAENDRLRVEAEKYGSELIAAGVPTEVTRYKSASHDSLASHPGALTDIGMFFRKRLTTLVLKS
ncbi:alpha/beta hydrolase [Caballeronia sp. LjRoot31]|uniref:alpha/beta hydrolase n=1 Tax=Caballeronia sp. LjRoot31 TaxID=3342324 RepID=UPI003ECF1FF8